MRLKKGFLYLYFFCFCQLLIFSPHFLPCYVVCHPRIIMFYHMNHLPSHRPITIPVVCQCESKKTAHDFRFIMCCSSHKTYISICNRLDSLSERLRQCRQLLCVCFARYPCHSHIILVISWDKVHMKVKYCLTCCFSVIL